jgi:hypothetical protein
MKKAITLIGIAVFFAAVFTLPQGTVNGQAGTQNFKSFQLVYHSDTRGYYRPCG